MDAIHRRIGTPVLTGLSLDPHGLAIEPGEVVPRRLPDLFPGAPLLVLGRYRGRASGEITVRGLDAAGTVREERVPAEVRENPAIASAWARGQVRQLEDRYASHDGDLATLEKAIVALSLRFGVLCRFTAYVAVDRSQIANPGGRVHRVTQPVELPAGYPAMAAPPSGPLPYFASEIDLTCAAMMPTEDVLHAALFGDVFAEEPLQESCDFAPPKAPYVSDMFSLDGCQAASELSEPEEETRSLADILTDSIPIDASQAANLVAEIAETVKRLRDEGPLRGNLDPERIVIDAATLRLVRIEPSLESPTAALTGRGKGARRRSTDSAQAEVQALGVILYRLLTGREPYPEVARARAGRGRIIGPRQLIATIPAELESICLKALERDPGACYVNAGELAAALRGILQPRKGSFWK